MKSLHGDTTQSCVASSSSTRTLISAGFGVALPAVMGVLSGPILARVLGVRGRGQLAAAIAIATLVLSLGDFGMKDSILLQTARTGSRSSVVRRTALRIYALVALLCISVAAVLSFLNLLSLIMTVAISIPSLMLACAIPRSEASGLRRVRTLASERCLQSTFRIVGIVLIASVGIASPGTVLLIHLSSIGIAALVVHWLNRDAAVEDSAPSFRVTHFAATSWSAGIATAVMLRLDQIAVGGWIGNSQLGLYVVAASIGEIPLLSSAALKMAYQGRIASEGTASSLGIWFLSIPILGLGAACVFALHGRRIITLIYGASFADASSCTALLLLAAIFIVTMDLSGASLLALGHPRYLLGASVMAASITGAAILPAIEKWGILGAALVSLLGYGAGATFQVVALLRVDTVLAASLSHHMRTLLFLRA